MVDRLLSSMKIRCCESKSARLLNHASRAAFTSSRCCSLACADQRCKALPIAASRLAVTNRISFSSLKDSPRLWPWGRCSSCECGAVVGAYAAVEQLTVGGVRSGTQTARPPLVHLIRTSSAGTTSMAPAEDAYQELHPLHYRSGCERLKRSSRRSRQSRRWFDQNCQFLPGISYILNFLDFIFCSIVHRLPHRSFYGQHIRRELLPQRRVSSNQRLVDDIVCSMTSKQLIASNSFPFIMLKGRVVRTG